jgi:mono/diheme cytochrome c family protein
LGLATVSGCANEYSAAVQFKVRNDPIWIDKPTQEFYEPDHPGELPLPTLEKAREPGNPYHVAKGWRAFDPRDLTAEDRQAFAQGLADLFGTPQVPWIAGVLDSKAGGTQQAVEILRLDDATLARGSSLYRVQCLTCHGLMGDGRGWTAPWVNPHPRDYRLGKFKFQSVDQASDGLERKPLRADLLRTIQYGVEGTSMPAFNLLSTDDQEALVSYVIYLSVRGEAEYQTMKQGVTLEGDGYTFSASRLPGRNISGYLRKAGSVILRSWAEAQAKPIEAAPYPYDDRNEEQYLASLRRGYALFVGSPEEMKKVFPAEKYAKDYPNLFPMKKVKKGDKEVQELDVAESDKRIADLAKGISCIKCHIDFGRRAKFGFDEWGTMTKPANLMTGVYRGGRRPVDLYWRIHSGINGSGMSPFGATIKGEQIWDLVNFVRAMPFPAMRDKLREDGIDIQ